MQYNGVMLQKKKLNSFQDGSKKKLQINTKDNFWMVCFFLRFHIGMLMLGSLFLDIGADKSSFFKINNFILYFVLI